MCRHIMTEISLIVTLNSQFNSTHLNYKKIVPIFVPILGCWLVVLMIYVDLAVF